MRRGLVCAGLLSFSTAALAQAPAAPAPTQNEQGACVSLGVQDRFREPGSAEALALDIVSRCIPEHRATVEKDPARRARFDQHYADERAWAIEVSTLRIERLRSNAAAASTPKGEPSLTVPGVELILRMATQGWRERVRVSETVLKRRAPGEWQRSAIRKVEVESGGGHFATYYVDNSGRVVGLFVDSGPAGECRAFGPRETLAVEAALVAVPAATAQEVRLVRASARSGWTPGLSAMPARIGPYLFSASRIGKSGPGRTGCRDRLSLTLAPSA
jgi:hypothetical protein